MNETIEVPVKHLIIIAFIVILFSALTMIAVNDSITYTVTCTGGVEYTNTQVTEFHSYLNGAYKFTDVNGSDVYIADGNCVIEEN